MKRLIKIVAAFITIQLLLSALLVCYAHPKAEEHNKEIEAVLFEAGYSKYQSEKIKTNVKAIEYAAQLAIDQFGGNSKSYYTWLKNQGMGGLPSKFSVIDYRWSPLDKDKRIEINANTHRTYTHQGWDREYTDDRINKFWGTRKKVLLGTLNTIFKFNSFSFLFGYTEECNSLAGIIYYVHILGDYEEADNYRKISRLTPIAGHKDTDQYDIICDLRNYIGILFEDQSNSYEYKELIKDLDSIEKKAGKLVRSTGGVNSDDEFNEYHQYAEDLMQTLVDHIPRLLKNEPFFSNVFYPDI